MLMMVMIGVWEPPRWGIQRRRREHRISAAEETMQTGFDERARERERERESEARVGAGEMEKAAKDGSPLGVNTRRR